MENNNKTKKILKNIAFILLMLIYIFSILYIQLQNDTLFDIKMGEKYLNEGVTLEDDFSIHTGLEYVSHHFMPNILTYLLYDNMGFNGLFLLEMILSCLLALVFYIANRLFLKSKKLAYMFVFIELFLMTSFISVRAQMYSYILILLEIILIELFLRGGKKRYLICLTILPFILVNFHAGIIPFYFIILLVYMCNYLRIRIFRIDYEESYIKRLKYLLIPIIIGSLLTFINPFGIKGVTYAFKTIDNSFITKYIAEFQPYKITANIGYVMTAYWFITIMILLFTNKKIKLYHLLLFLGTTFMSLLAIRNFSLLVLMSVVILPYFEDVIEQVKLMLFKDLYPKGQTAIKLTIYGVFAIIFTVIGSSNMVKRKDVYLPTTTYPLQAVEYVKDNIGTDKKIFNEYFYGSLLMFNDIKVFIDSRCDLYTNEYNPNTNVANDYINAMNCYTDYNVILQKYNIEYLFIKKSSSLAKNVINNSDYVKLYEDNLVYIFKTPY